MDPDVEAEMEAQALEVAVINSIKPGCTMKELVGKLRVRKDVIENILKKNSHRVRAVSRYDCVRAYIERYVIESLRKYAYRETMFDQHVRFFLGKKIMALLDERGMRSNNVLTRYPLREKYYIYDNPKDPMESEWAMLDIGEEFYITYAHVATINYMKLVMFENLSDRLIELFFLRRYFGYPLGKMRKKSKKTVKKQDLLREAMKGLPGKRMVRTFRSFLEDREKLHMEVVEKLLRSVNKQVELDKEFEIKDERGSTSSKPDLHIGLKDRGLEGAIEIKTYLKRFGRFADVSTISQLVQYCGNFKFVWVLTTSDLEIGKELCKAGRATGIKDIKGRNVKGKLILDRFKEYVEEYQKKHLGPIDRRVHFSPSIVGDYLLGNIRESKFATMLRNYLYFQGKLAKAGTIKNIVGQFNTVLDKYRGSVSNKSVLYLYGTNVLELLRPEETSAEKYKKVSEKFDLILAITELTDFLSLLQEQGLNEEIRIMKKLMRES